MQALSTYHVTMKHDTGTVVLTIAARSRAEATRLACEAENAPLRSAVSVVVATRGH